MRNLKSNNSGKLWDFAYLNGCFPRPKITASDIDGIVEVNGHFLVMETKYPGEEMSTGQWRVLERFAKQGHMVQIITGRSLEDYDTLEIVDDKGRRHLDTRPIREIAHEWGVMADITPDPYTQLRRVDRESMLNIIAENKRLAEENKALRDENEKLRKRLNVKRRPKVQTAYIDLTA